MFGSRAIMTSVDLTMASAESPRRSLSTLSASLVMIAVSRCVADAQAHLAEQAVDAHLLDEAAQADFGR